MEGEYSSIYSLTLQEFRGKKQSRDGYVYFFLGKPIIQLHCLADDYTIFWLGYADVKVFCLNITETIKEKIILDSKVFNKGYFSFTQMDKTKQGSFVKRTESLSSEDLRTNFYAFVETLVMRPSSVSNLFLRLELETYDYYGRQQDLRVSLWADTSAFLEEEKEVGVTSNFLFMRDIDTLFRATSENARYIPSWDLSELVNLVDKHIKEIKVKRGFPNV